MKIYGFYEESLYDKFLFFFYKDLANFLFQKQFCLPHYFFWFEKQEE